MIGIVVSIFNKPITDGLLDGCIKSLKEIKNNGTSVKHLKYSYTED